MKGFIPGMKETKETDLNASPIHCIRVSGCIGFYI